MGGCVDKLRGILHPESIVEIRESKATLKENDVRNPYSLTLKNVPEGSLLIKIDRFQGGRGFFDCRHGICKRSDYAILTENELVLLEMKSNYRSGTAKDVSRQLHGAHCVLDYCVSIGERFFNDKKGFSLPNEVHRVLLVQRNPTGKRTAQPVKSSCGAVDRRRRV